MGHTSSTDAGKHLARRRPLALLPVAAVIGLLFSVVAAPPSVSQEVNQGVGLGIAPVFPNMVTVGDHVPAELVITNLSEGVGPVTLAISR